MFANAKGYGPTYAPTFAIAELNKTRNSVVATVRKSGELAAIVPLENRSISLFRYALVLPRKEIGYSGVLVSNQCDDDALVELGRLMSQNF